MQFQGGLVTSPGPRRVPSQWGAVAAGSSLTSPAAALLSTSILPLGQSCESPSRDACVCSHPGLCQIKQGPWSPSLVYLPAAATPASRPLLPRLPRPALPSSSHPWEDSPWLDGQFLLNSQASLPKHSFQAFGGCSESCLTI